MIKKLPRFKDLMKDEIDSFAVIGLIAAKCCGAGIPWLVCILPLSIGGIVRFIAMLITTR